MDDRRWGQHRGWTVLTHRRRTTRAASPAKVIKESAQKESDAARNQASEAAPRQCLVPVLRDVAGHAGHGVDDVAREQGKRAEHRDRDDCQDDAVLGHRLPVFTGEPVVELLHGCRPPGTIGTAAAPTIAMSATSAVRPRGAIPQLRRSLGRQSPPERASSGSEAEGGGGLAVVLCRQVNSARMRTALSIWKDSVRVRDEKSEVPQVERYSNWAW